MERKIAAAAVRQQQDAPKQHLTGKGEYTTLRL